MTSRLAVDLAFERKKPWILAEEIAVDLMPRQVQAVQREIDSRFTESGKYIPHKRMARVAVDTPSPRSCPDVRKRGAR